MRHFLFMIMLVVCQTAMGNDYVTVFKAGGNVCTPITIKSSAGEFVLTSEVRITKSLIWFEAFDCQGRKLMNPSGSVSVGTGKTTVRTYVFTTLFPTTQRQDESEEYREDSNVESSYGGGSMYDVGNGSSDNTQKIAKFLADYSTYKGWDVDYNSITIDTGYGYPYGGLGVRARYISAWVIGLSLGFGYNTKYDALSYNNKKFYWNAGISFHLNKFLAMSFYGGPQYFKEFEKTDVGVGAFVEYSHNIYKFIGVNAGIGGIMDGEQDMDKVKGHFAGHIGLTFLIFSDD